MGLFDWLKGKKAPPPRRPLSLDLENERDVSAKALPPDFIAATVLKASKLAYRHPISADQQGIHIESLLCSLGAMAGFGCQIAIREGLIKTGKLPLDKAFVFAKTNDGGIYYFGDQLNQPLLEAPMSVWAQVAGAVQHVGKPVPDIHDIVRFVSSTVGGPEFGTLRVSQEHQPMETPIQSLKKHWAAAYKLVKSQTGDPLFTGWYFALAAQQLIIEGKDIIDATIASQIVMESAVAMAKIDPPVIGFSLD